MIPVLIVVGVAVLGYAVGKNTDKIENGVKKVKRNHKRKQLNKKNTEVSKTEKND